MEKIKRLLLYAGANPEEFAQVQQEMHLLLDLGEFFRICSGVEEKPLDFFHSEQPFEDMVLRRGKGSFDLYGDTAAACTVQYYLIIV